MSAVEKVRVSFYATHTFAGDLNITLTAPDSTAVLIVSLSQEDSVYWGSDNYGTGTDDGDRCTIDDDGAVTVGATPAPRAGTFKPSNPMTPFIGVDPNGDWTVSILDLDDGDTGTLFALSLFLTIDGEEHRYDSTTPPVALTDAPDPALEISFTVAVATATDDGASYEVRVTPLLLGVDGILEDYDDGVIPVELEDTTLLTQYSNLDVSPLVIGEQRAGSVTLSMYDTTPLAGSDVPGSLIASLEPQEQALWIGYKRPGDSVAEGLVYGQCNVLEDYENGTVTLKVQSAARTAHAQVRRGDTALNIDKNRGRLRATGGVSPLPQPGTRWADDELIDLNSIDLIIDAARNTPDQQTRAVPALGVAVEDRGDFPGAEDAPFIDFERGQEVNDLVAQFSRAITGPDPDWVPAWSWPATYYAKIELWDPATDPEAPGAGELGRNLDPADPDDPQPGEVIFDCGLGLDNAFGLNIDPGLPTTHQHALDAAKAYRETSADAEASERVGVWTGWAEIDLTIKRASAKTVDGVRVITPADTSPLRAYADAKVKALANPPKFFTIKLRPDDAQPYRFGHRDWNLGATTGDYYLGDYVRVRAQRGYRARTTLATILGAKFTQDGSNGLPVIELTMIPAIGGVPGDDPGEA